MFDVDVVIAGGGPAGCSAAAALDAFKFTQLLVDGPDDRSKRLAGELLHPPAVEDLTALGFSTNLSATEHQDVKGFSVIGHPSQRTALLPYRPGELGFSLEHGELVDALQHGLTEKPRIQVASRARVSSVENVKGGVRVVISRGNQKETVFARLLVAADGRGSQIRKLLNVSETQERLSTMLGVKVDARLLPNPGYGHIFTGGPAPVLAYAISKSAARAMVDLPLGSNAQKLRDEPDLLRGVPEPLRSAILEAADGDTVRQAANESRIPKSVVVGRTVMIGDAAGCSHPISASGMSSSTRDARVLADAISRHEQDIDAALSAYSRWRRPVQRTRITLAEALFRAFADRSEAMDALREGLFRYWERTADGAATSMGLLSTRETRTWVMAQEYARVVGYGMQVLAEQTARTRNLKRLAQAGQQLLLSAKPHISRAAKSSWEELGNALRRST